MRFVLLFIAVIVISLANCAYTLNRYEDQKELQNHSSMKTEHDGILFCKIGCVLTDSVNRLRIDDPGRNFHDTFSVISNAYVIEVIGGSYGMSDHILRVMVSEETLGKTTSTILPTVDLQNLILLEGEVIQRITFDLLTKITIINRSESTGEFKVRIPLVVPHVLFIYDYKLKHRGETVTGVVTLEVSSLPRTLEVEVGRREDGRCWMIPLDSKEFEDFMIAVRVRGNNRHVLAEVITAVQAFAEYGVLDTYMDQIDGFAFEFLKESILQRKNVIEENNILTRLCREISKNPPEIDDTTTTTENAEDNGGLLPIEISLKIRSKSPTRSRHNGSLARSVDDRARKQSVASQTAKLS